jgi:5-methylcytosine-specific restriction endonuclease McrA
MAERGEKRDPSSHRTPTQIRRMDRGYNATPEIQERRSKNNQARRMMKKKGLVQKGDGMDVDHKIPLRNGGGNSPSNLRVISQKKNRGWNKKK